MRTLICGCGYIGTALGAELVRQGHEVFGLRRSADASPVLAAAGITPLSVDITVPAQLSALPLPFDWVINTTASGHGGTEDYRKVYLLGNQNLVNWLSGTGVKKFVYTSSTGVYGQTDGSLVVETSETAPTSETSKILVETEKVLLEAAKNGLPAMILRVAGIYGPGRGYYLSQLLKGEAKITGHPERLLNMIHRDDVVGAIIATLKNGRAGEIYNAVDDEPVPQVRVFRFLAESLGVDMPTAETETEGHKREITHKKVSNRKLKTELGYVFKYPNFREGFTAEIQRLQDAGVI